MPKFTSNDAEIHYQTFGDTNNPAIIFSNSLGTKYTMWQPQIDALQNDFFVICYDTRGHGASSAPKGPYTIDQLGLDVIHILDHLNISKASFCGISMGGITGLQLGLIAPQRFLSITIANSAAKIGQDHAWLSRADAVEANGLADIVSTTHTRWFSDKFDYIHDAIAQKTIQSLSVTAPKGYAASCRALAQADLREDIAQIQVPCLALCGGLDSVTTVADGEFMQAQIPNCEIAVIDASHLSNIEAPQQFNQVFADFIAKH